MKLNESIFFFQSERRDEVGKNKKAEAERKEKFFVCLFVVSKKAGVEVEGSKYSRNVIVPVHYT